jgi:ssDNA-binding Zn-finger/Zn-ribbon topoisomerase 1
MKEQIPVFTGRLRKDLRGGIEFDCPRCGATHRHSPGEGHRMPHCRNYPNTGYIIKLTEEDKDKCPELYRDQAEYYCE